MLKTLVTVLVFALACFLSGRYGGALVVRAWGSGSWSAPAADPSAPREAGLLRLDSAKAHERLGWRPVYGVDEALARTVAWYRAAGERGFDARAFSRGQIRDYDAALTAGAAR